MYSIPRDFRATAQIYRGVTLVDFLVIIFMGLIGYLISNQAHLVADSWATAFNIYNVCVAVFLVIPSSWNHGKKNYQSLYYMVVRDRSTYHPENGKYRAEPIDNKIIDEKIQLLEYLAAPKKKTKKPPVPGHG